MIAALKFFFLFSFLSSFLWFIDKPLLWSVWFSIFFFTVLWLVIDSLSNLLDYLNLDPLWSSLALNIGLKFFTSIIFVFAMYIKGFFEGTAIVSIFLLLYFIYTYLYAKYNKNIDI